MTTRERPVRERRRCRASLALVAALALGACTEGGGSGDDGTSFPAVDAAPGADPADRAGTPPDDLPSVPPVVYQSAPGIVTCSIEDIRAKVDFDMRDYYIYYDQVPVVRLEDFDRAEQLIRALRVEPDIFSFVTDREEQAQLFEEGTVEGYGFWFRPEADGVVRFREILAGSPAEGSGLARGDELIALDGRAIGEYDEEALRSALRGNRLSFTVRRGDGEPRTVTLERDGYFWFTAPLATIMTPLDGGWRVGYLRVDRFLDTTTAEIDDHMAWFAAKGGIDELVLDLRYNGGGRSRVARRLAAQIGGARLHGAIYQIGRANDRYSEFDTEVRFENAPNALGLPRVIVLMTEFSASASEAVVNGLEPYLDVVVIGERSLGKPFSSFSEDYCDKSINAMSLLRTNAVGVSVVGGIAPDCPVDDTWRAPAEDPADALLGAALAYIAEGSCPTAPVAEGTTRTVGARGPEARAMSEGQIQTLDLLEPPRNLRRLRSLREWSHGQHQPSFPRVP